MASKKTLKKMINQICEELFAEGVARSLYGHDAQKDNGQAILFSIVKTHNNFISRISHPEPGMTPKVYFKDLREKFSAEAGEILDQINS
ncbi:MAG: hypothetical protein IJ618_01255 [Prevotella sp.]|nr:hypothetical protein [Prevotella sp.]